MLVPIWRRGFLIALVMGLLVFGGWWYRDAGRAWLNPSALDHAPPPAAEAHQHDHPLRLKLSAQAKSNLGLRLAPLQLSTYWRTAQMPGAIIERPGRSNRGVSNTLTGIITKVHVLPGQLVQPGEELLTLRLASEYLQNTQAQLFKTASDLRINAEEQQRLRGVAENQSLFKSRLLELGYEERRLQAAWETYRQDLLTRGVSAEQVQQITGGQFLTEYTVKVPKPSDSSTVTVFEVEELRANLGELVQAGQILAYLANHEALDVEGKAFEQEAPLLQKAAKEAWPVAMIPLDQSPEWPTLPAQLTIRFISSHVDPATRTLSFFLPLENPSREVPVVNVGTRRIWRFRPGQRIRLGVPIERLDQVFVVPREAVVHDDPEVYLFRQNGGFLERRAVFLRYEDQDHAVLAHDGSIAPGNVIALNAAVALNRAIKAQALSPSEDAHDHAGHSHDH
jgi:cobalt-zinc-cadmium efflux system membrane fusion protein